MNPSDVPTVPATSPPSGHGRDHPETVFGPLLAGLLGTWSIVDPQQRLTQVREVCDEDLYYVDPLARLVGVDAFADHAGSFAERMPGARLERISEVDAHHDVLRFGWLIYDADGVALLDGFTTGVFDVHLRFRAVLTFFGSYQRRLFPLATARTD
nr:hypothetical protein [Micromonospora sp. DSM 115978]